MNRRKGRLPQNIADIKLPGTGQYMMNAISLLCYGEPRALLDVNMALVLTRHFGIRMELDLRRSSDLKALANGLVSERSDALFISAREICTPELSQGIAFI